MLARPIRDESRTRVGGLIDELNGESGPS